MAQLYEITTLAGNEQKYELIEVVETTRRKNEPGFRIQTLESDTKTLEHLTIHAHNAYSITNLDHAIKLYPPIPLPKENEHLTSHHKFARPGKLRLIYDALPLSFTQPILRIYPIENQQLFLGEYNVQNAKLPLEKITFSQESGGEIELQFAGLHVFLHLQNAEKAYELYYGRNLKKSMNVE